MLNPSAVLYGPHDVRIEDRPVPEPAPGQVLVEIAAVGICVSDVHYYEHGRIGDYVVCDPMIINHESAGTVVAVGDGVDRNRKSAVTGGDRVLITGAGPIGLLAGQVARALGAADTPVITDVSDFRLARARDLGLRTAQAGTPLEEEFDVLLECSGAPAALTSGMRALAPAGRVALVGMGADSVTLDVALVQGRELSVIGVFRYANTYPLALQLISSGAVNVTDVIAHRFTSKTPNVP